MPHAALSTNSEFFHSSPVAYPARTIKSLRFTCCPRRSNFGQIRALPLPGVGRGWPKRRPSRRPGEGARTNGAVSLGGINSLATSSLARYSRQGRGQLRSDLQIFLRLQSGDKESQMLLYLKTGDLEPVQISLMQFHPQGLEGSFGCLGWIGFS